MIKAAMCKKGHGKETFSVLFHILDNKNLGVAYENDAGG